jgi:hypothetical protein
LGTQLKHNHHIWTKTKAKSQYLEHNSKQNPNIWNKAKAKSQYLEHISSKITMQNVFGSKFKQNPNTGNTTQTKSQYWKHNSNKITISGQPIAPTAHYSDSPFLRQPIIPSNMVKSSIIILKPVVFLLYLTED